MQWELNTDKPVLTAVEQIKRAWHPVNISRSQTSICPRFSGQATVSKYNARAARARAGWISLF